MAETLSIDQVNIERMVRETGIFADRIREALDPQPVVCVATTVAEAREAYDEAPEGSVAEATALAKLVELATTVAEVQEAFNMTSSGSEAEAVAIRKLATFFLKQ